MEMCQAKLESAACAEGQEEVVSMPFHPSMGQAQVAAGANLGELGEGTFQQVLALVCI